MRLGGKWIGDRGVKLSEGQEAFACRAADRVLRFQRRLADQLNGLAGCLPVYWCRMLLLVFCVVLAGYCLMLVLDI